MARAATAAADATPRTRSSRRRRVTSTPTYKKTIALASGATVTVSATCDLFTLTSDDQRLVFALVDLLREYQQRGSAPQQLTEVTRLRSAPDAASE